MTPEVLVQRIEQMSAEQLAAVDRALTPEAIQAMLMLMPELEPVLMQFAEQQASNGGGDTAPATQHDAMQQFIAAIGAGPAA